MAQTLASNYRIVNGPLSDVISWASSAAAQTIVAAVAGQRIAVYGYVLISDTDTALQWEDEDGTALTGELTVIARDPLVVPQNDVPWFVTPAGKALAIDPTVACVGTGHILFAYVV